MRTIMMLVVLTCIGAIVYGNFHWNSKLSSAMDQEYVSTSADTNPSNTDEKMGENKEEVTE